MRSSLLEYRRRLCMALPGLQGEEWLAIGALINRIDRHLKAPKTTISISFSPGEAPILADILEAMARCIRARRRAAP
jgi:hypothetical protein